MFEIEKIKYGEMYYDNKNDCKVLYVECLAKDDHDSEHLRRAIVRFPKFVTEAGIKDVTHTRIEHGSFEDNFKYSLASQIPDYKYKSLKEEYSDLMNIKYDETLLYTVSDEAESSPFKFTISMEEKI